MIRIFLACAVLLISASEARGTELDGDPYSCYGAGRYDAMRSGLTCPKPSVTLWGAWTCATLREYLKYHTEAEARAKAAELHIPQWVIRKAESCPHD